MALNPTGPMTKEKVDKNYNNTSIQSYDFSEDGTSTDNFVDNEFAFGSGEAAGVRLQEVFIWNQGANPLAFQWLDYKADGKDSGVIPPNQMIQMERAYKTGISIRSLNAGSPSAFIIFGY